MPTQTKPIISFDLSRQNRNEVISLVELKSNLINTAERNLKEAVTNNGWEKKELYIRADLQEDWDKLNKFRELCTKKIIDIRHDVFLGTHVKVTLVYDPK